MIQTTYTHARANLGRLFDEVSDNQETVIIKRKGKEDIAFISASELDGLFETAHLLRSPKNAARLLTALKRALSDTERPMDIQDLKSEIGVEKD
ncbi:Antitoxin [Candidatus Desulfarcum epimagneticum]|uniref:Antitoxin n=1 Tax=uncultured Desulfobacteraceae bacterium TaxID=218296 RepID=A0A484HL28_9BACT|nr:Antitoxin [uncultured Desulfobacteraceae bacterium]